MIATPLALGRYLSTSPLLWLTVTLLAYQGGHWLYRRSGQYPIVNPVFISVTIVVVVLLITRTPYQTYFDGARFINLLLGPATVSLAIPLYGQINRLKTVRMPVAAALIIGSVTAIGSAVGIAAALGASKEILLSLAPKSATMPVAIGVSDKLGGLPPITALAVAVTGVSGAIMARGLLNFIRVDDPAVRGFAIGLTAHAIGTAEAFQINEVAGAFAGLGMGLNGVATAVLLPVILQFAGMR